jgi:hypothetical protein
VQAVKACISRFPFVARASSAFENIPAMGTSHTFLILSISSLMTDPILFPDRWFGGEEWLKYFIQYFLWEDYVFFQIILPGNRNLIDLITLISSA